MKRLLITAAALAMSACAHATDEGWNGTTHAQRVPYADNQTAWLIECGGLVERCYARAAAVCPAGYLIADQADRGRGATVIPNPAGAILVNNSKETLTVTCKA